MNNTLDILIESLSKEEVRFFKIFLNRTDTKNRKDLDLFDYMRKKKGIINTKDTLKKLKTSAESPSTQQAPLQAFKSQTKCFSNTSKEIIVSSI